MKPISDYTTNELSAKIEAIKAERERTANALKKYEEELERRENKNWIPLGDVLYSAKYESVDVFHVEVKMETTFNNYCCFYKYRDYLEAINKALVANAKGEPIDIKFLLPLLPKGWVACFDDGEWAWFKNKPELFGKSPRTYWCAGRNWCKIKGFNLKPAENWETSLMECGL